MDATVLVLPAAEMKLPRFKPVPVPKPPTRWEQFAAAKGIQNKKRSRMVFDEVGGAARLGTDAGGADGAAQSTEDYRPRFGYKSARAEKDWMVEVRALCAPSLPRAARY